MSFGESNYEWRFRLYQPEDRDAVVEIFKKQGLPVRLPFPPADRTAVKEGEDPSVVVGIVGLRNGVIKMALLSRATVEGHLVIAPNEPGQSYAIRRAVELSEGAIMQLGVELAKLRFPIFTDLTGYVPKSMPDMIEYLRKHLRFVDEGDEFHRLYKKVGH